MTNYERQLKFRKNHPGYNTRLQARKRASAKRDAEKRMAARQTAANAEALPALPASLTIPVPTFQLALPAPVEVLVFPGLKTIETMGVTERQRA